ncbi:MAG: FAD-dependent oxidoreductase [Hyphomicrobiaceae bacterium]|nr:FAD-dependent oxidoreductase [Hyphomicrobiaceae bacterium]
MESQTRVAVIGGGVVGCSVLYHLTKAGWSDVLLVERDTLTCGSTWHAAGGMHTLNGDPNVARLQRYTIDLYREIEQISGQDCGIHLTGGLLLADTPERLEWLKGAHARGCYLGMETELISVEEAAAILPLMDPDHFVGALYNPIEGHVDPSGVTHAYAKVARMNGAKIHQKTFVQELVQRSDGTWDVVTDKGTVHAEHVVNAGGLWAREVGRMAGLELPVLAMEHHFLVTEDMPEVKRINAETGKEIVHVIDFGGEIYMRQERDGMLMGTYEKAAVPWSPRETPWDFAAELLPPDIDRLLPSLEIGFSHFPAFNDVGIREIINGPFTFAPDGNPLVGPVQGLRNYWCACGVMAGFSQGGGVGLVLSNWIVEGDPGFDIWGMDVARYGDWATLAYTNAKVKESYSHRFSIVFPNEERPAGRPLRTTPIYDRLRARNAVWGAAYGIEHVLWFQEPGKDPEEELTFRRSNAHDRVAEECAAVRTAAGLQEISTFAKYEVAGPNAEGWLSHLLANKMPREGRLALSPMLNDAGKLIGDFTVGKLESDRFFLFGSGVAENYHMRWFREHLVNGGVEIRPLGLSLVGLSIAGPNARAILQSVTGEDVSPDALKFLDFRKIDIGMVQAIVGRISFTGDLGYELWVASEYQRALFDLLMEAGEPHGLRLFGTRALNSLRLEKSFGSWATEFRPIYGPCEAGLDRFVELEKNDFVGRDAAAWEMLKGPERRLISLKVDASDADVIGDEPIWHDNQVIGWVTSGGYAHHSRASIALGYVPSALAGSINGSFEIEILGERHSARMLSEPLFDPAGERMRG